MEYLKIISKKFGLHCTSNSLSETVFCPYWTELIDPLRNIITFCVKVPVLSLNTYFIWPSSSFKAVLLPRYGIVSILNKTLGRGIGGNMNRTLSSKVPKWKYPTWCWFLWFIQLSDVRYLLLLPRRRYSLKEVYSLFYVQCLRTLFNENNQRANIFV